MSSDPRASGMLACGSHATFAVGNPTFPVLASRG